jgi:hypothetical protein
MNEKHCCSKGAKGFLYRVDQLIRAVAARKNLASVRPSFRCHKINLTHRGVDSNYKSPLSKLELVLHIRRHSEDLGKLLNSNLAVSRGVNSFYGSRGSPPK